MERLGAAHRPMTTRVTDESSHYQPKGTLMGGWKQKPGGVVSQREDRSALDVTPGDSGFTADLDFTRRTSREGIDTEQYQAGPYRTQLRAQIAGESLLGRVEGGGGGRYQTGSYYESEAERRANEAGLL